MTFERLKPFLVLALIAIVCIGGAAFYSSKLAECEREQRKANAQSDCDTFKNHFNSFLADSLDFTSLDIITTKAAIDSSVIHDTCRDFLTQRDSGLLGKCLDKQLDYLRQACDVQNFNDLIKEYSLVLDVDDTRRFYTIQISNCIQYKESKFQSDLKAFSDFCRNQSLTTPYVASEWIKLRNNASIYTTVNKYSECKCCSRLINDINTELSKWEKIHQDYKRKYDLLEKSLVHPGDDYGPLDRIILLPTQFKNSKGFLPVNSYYSLKFKNKSYNILR